MMRMGNYVVIQSWMVRELKLKGNELLIYAIVYGFSQDDQCFGGTLKYLQDWTASTKQGVLKALKNLTDKGLILKHERVDNGVRRCYYQTIEPEQSGGKQSLPGAVNKVDQGGKQSLPGVVNKVDQGGKQSLPVLYNTNLNTNIINSAQTEEKEKKHRYGEYKNVLLTDDELAKLKELFPHSWADKIRQLDEGIAVKGYRYKSHFAAIRAWARRDAERQRAGELDRQGNYTGLSHDPDRPSGDQVARDDMDRIRAFMQSQKG